MEATFANLLQHLRGSNRYISIFRKPMFNVGLIIYRGLLRGQCIRWCPSEMISSPINLCNENWWLRFDDKINQVVSFANVFISDKSLQRKLVAEV